ncbi:MAG TPA: TonB family protein [Terriglobales bacterium]
MTTIPQSGENMLFSSLPPAKPRWGAFGFSFVAQAVGLSLVATITFATPKFVEKKYQHIQLAQVPEEEHTLKPRPVERPKLTARLREPEPVPIAQPKLRMPPEIVPPQVKQLQSMPKLDATSAPKPQFAAQPTKMFDQVADNKPAGPNVRTVQTNNFGTGSSADPTLRNKTAAQVQTGGFGSPTGFAPNPNSTSARGNVAPLGSFDLPQGPGYGNGTGGAKGARGTIASAGFGNGTAIDGGRGGHSGNGRVQTTGFGDAAVQQAAAPQQHQPAPVVKVTATPVSIQSKPLPSYTAEAREMRVEGEVLLEVTFTATGQVRIVRIVRGLGHGLDESAMRAAQGIRFTPAQRDGRPVDSTATLHIVFQLS